MITVGNFTTNANIPAIKKANIANPIYGPSTAAAASCVESWFPKINNPPTYGVMVVARELTPCAKLSLLDAVFGGPKIET